MIAVRTPSRLHFGLLSLPAAEARWPNRDGQTLLPARAFGGVGLMVREPGIALRVTPAAAWGAEGPRAERALAFARRYEADLQRERPDLNLSAQQVVIEHAAPAHVGLGTGTQLGLAVARALAAAWGLEESVSSLARRIGRGLRSALGVHGFERGGFLVEAGKRSPDDLSPLVAWQPFSEAWRIVLILPAHPAGLHGPREREAFARLAQHGGLGTQTEALCRLVLLGLLPALREHDLETFGEALYDFNARSGELFAAVQGGIYSSNSTAEIVAFVRGLGIKGVGQSSWGPTVFAVVEDDVRAGDLAHRVCARFGLNRPEVLVTRACNHGAVLA